MQKRVDLRTGNITKTLVELALPLMGMSLIQMAYNLIDMFWIGRLGAGPVAAVGTGGLLIWLSMGIHTIAQLGGQVFVGQNLGRDDRVQAGQYATASIHLSILVSALLGSIFFFFRTPVVAYFKLNDPAVVQGAEQYIKITGGLILFLLMGKLLTALIATTGDSKTPFIATAVGLVCNIIVDPILIFGWFGFPELGIQGAAIATVMAQMVVVAILAHRVIQGGYLFDHIHLARNPGLARYREILRLGLPTALQASFFPLVSIVISRMVAGFGDNAVAVQRIGSQVESISWMTTDGFSIAVNSFMAQNYGAQDMERTKRGYYQAMKMLGCLGILATGLLIFCAEPIFAAFIVDTEVIEMGRIYLVIVGISQFFLCAEILSGSAMNALGRTLVPAIVVIFFTGIRIPLAALLSATTLGLSGIWWSLTISTILKGTSLMTMMFILLRGSALHGGRLPGGGDR